MPPKPKAPAGPFALWLVSYEERAIGAWVTHPDGRIGRDFIVGPHEWMTAVAEDYRARVPKAVYELRPAPAPVIAKRAAVPYKIGGGRR